VSPAALQSLNSPLNIPGADVCTPTPYTPLGLSAAFAPTDITTDIYAGFVELALPVTDVAIDTAAARAALTFTFEPGAALRTGTITVNVTPVPRRDIHLDSAEVLALSDVGPQAIRAGRSFGTQFHPEANEAIVTRWMAGEGAVELARLGISPHDLAEATRRETPRAGLAAGALVEWFLSEIASSPMPKHSRRT
jgi:hypothetical protein